MNFVEKPLIYVNLIQDLLKIVEEFAKTQIKRKIVEICDVLSLKTFTEEKEQALYKQFLNIFQDYNTSVFHLNQENIDEIIAIYREKAEETVKFPYNSFEFNRKLVENPDIIDKIVENSNKIADNSDKIPEKPDEFSEFLSQLFETPELQKLISVYHSLCIYMSLNDPPLHTNISGFFQRKFIYVLYKKNEFYCIDGFVKEKAPAIVVLPAVYRGNFAYNGIKPAVLILGKEFISNEEMKRIIEELKEKEAILMKENIAKKDENMKENRGNCDEISMKNHEEIKEISNEKIAIISIEEKKVKEIDEKIKGNREEIQIIEIPAVKGEISVEILQNKEEIPLIKEEEINEFRLFRNEKPKEENSTIKPAENIANITKKERFNNKKAKTLNQFFFSKISFFFFIKLLSFLSISYTERGDYHKKEIKNSKFAEETSPLIEKIPIEKQ